MDYYYPTDLLHNWTTSLIRGPRALDARHPGGWDKFDICIEQFFTSMLQLKQNSFPLDPSNAFYLFLDTLCGCNQFIY